MPPLPGTHSEPLSVRRSDLMSAARISSILSSRVPTQRNWCTGTVRFWPMRKAQSVAWFATVGFHPRSKGTTGWAAIRLSPVPPA
jgi:hypothetical protein